MLMASVKLVTFISLLKLAETSHHYGISVFRMRPSEGSAHLIISSPYLLPSLFTLTSSDGVLVHQEIRRCQSANITIDLDKYELKSGIEQKGLILQATEHLDVYVRYCSTSCVMYSVEPTTSAHTEFTAVGYTSAPGFKAVITIIAMEDGTSLTVSSTSVIINKYHTYTKEMTGDPTGIQITANKPVSVFSGTRCSYIPAGVPNCDPIYKNLPAKSTLGTMHILPPIYRRPGTTGYLLRTVAVDGSTSVTVKGGGQAPHTFTTSSKSDLAMTDADVPRVVICSKPCIVVQFNYGSTKDSTAHDPFMALIPDVAKTQQSVAFRTSGNSLGPWVYDLTIITKTPNATIDDQIITAWTPVEGADGYYKTSEALEKGEHHIYTAAPDGLMAYVSGRSNDYVASKSSVVVNKITSGKFTQDTLITNGFKGYPSQEVVSAIPFRFVTLRQMMCIAECVRTCGCTCVSVSSGNKCKMFDVPASDIFKGPRADSKVFVLSKA